MDLLGMISDELAGLVMFVDDKQIAFLVRGGPQHCCWVAATMIDALKDFPVQGNGKWRNDVHLRVKFRPYLTREDLERSFHESFNPGLRHFAQRLDVVSRQVRIVSGLCVDHTHLWEV